MSKIKQVIARQVLDSNGRPVVETDILTEAGFLGRAGASLAPPSAQTSRMFCATATQISGAA